MKSKNIYARKNQPDTSEKVCTSSTTRRQLQQTECNPDGLE